MVYEDVSMDVVAAPRMDEAVEGSAGSSHTADDEEDDENDENCMSYSTSEDEEFYDAEAPTASPQ